jgi:formate hydrogenlyase subunit 3/multisubunit Na+/H+ antiporter MnhD subunit
MTAILGALALLAAGAVAAAAFRRRPRVAAVLGALAPAGALALVLVPCARVLGGEAPESMVLAWPAPLGSVSLGLDALSAFFLLVVLAIGALAAVYGVGYLRDDPGPRAGLSWCFFDVLVASMAVVVLARQAILFLLAWETMGLSSFLLVAYHHERAEARRAAWTYLVAMHLGGCFLIAMFFVLAQGAGSFDFARFGQGLTPAAATACFLLAVVGFGTKAGLMPFHVWLPEAHPAAPSHVSGLMSGVMIKTGIYGIARVLLLLGPPKLSWGLLLLALGGASALLGVLFALAQHDLKRLLAYHSVENVGIIVLGLGVGVTGLAMDSPAVAALGFAGGLLHVLNHALFKALLFFGAGSVLRATGTGEIDELGGLMRRLPVTATTFLVGSVAISGLPPFNGFVSELLVYWGGFSGASALAAPAAVPLGAVIAVLGAVGGLALACFTKAFGIVFLGLPRSSRGQAAGEAPSSMLVPMVVLAAACLVLGLGGGLAVPALQGLVSEFVGEAARQPLRDAGLVLSRVALVAGGTIGLVALLALARRLLLRGRDVREAVTWDCGYVAPSPTMQYTASSFAQPIVGLFRSLLGTRKRVSSPEIHFPDSAHLETETPDLGREGIYEPLVESAGGALRRILILQHGRLHVYVLGLVVTLLALLLWQVR